MFTFKTMMRGSSITANAARLTFGLCLLGLMSANAAVITFNVSGTLGSSGSTLGGTITIDNTAGAITAAAVTISAPDLDTCNSVGFHAAVPGVGYEVNIGCLSGNVLALALATPLQPVTATLNGYVGGPFVLAGNSYYLIIAGAGAGADFLTGGGLSSLVVAPTFSKAFGAPTVPSLGTTTLTFTIVNPNATSLTGLAFTDVLPGFEVGLPNGLTNSCGGSFTANSGAPEVVLANGTVAASSTCQISINVTAGGGGLETNTTSTLTSSAPTAPAATASIVITAPPTFSKAFSAPTVPLGGTTTLTFTIVNPNPIPLTGVAFTDTLPTGLNFVSFLGASAACGGGPLSANPVLVSLTAGIVAASSTCTFSFSVAGTAGGAQTNTTSTLTSNAPTAPAATASIYVTVAPTFSKAFGQPSVFTGSTATLTFTIGNSNAVPVTGLAFTDTLPVGLIVATPDGLTNTCGGTATAVAGSNSIALSAGTVTASSSCTITVSVFAIARGVQNNTTSTLTSIAPTAPAATASIIVFPAYDTAFQISYAADPSAGESYVNIINTGANGAPPLGPGLGAATGNTCVNVYAVDPSEELIACCSCLLTPNQVMNLGVNADLTIKTETGVVPPSVTIKLVNTLAGPTGSGTSCTNSATSAGGAGFPLAVGMVAYGTTPQAVGTVYNQVEHPFIPSTLSAAELASLTGRCSSIVGNASGYGICLSCRSGALGATKQ